MSSNSGMSGSMRYLIVLGIAAIVLLGLVWYIKGQMDRVAEKQEQQMAID